MHQSSRYYFLSLFIFVLVLIGCNSSEKKYSDKTTTNKESEKSDGTIQMMDSIKKIISKVDFLRHPYESAEKLKLVEQQVNAAKANNRMSANLYVQYGKTLLETGRSREAIGVFEEIMEKLPENKEVNTTSKALHEALAISYMRLGEQTNCRDNHSVESCLFPIKGQGLHKDETGSRKAISIYENILEAFPEDLQSKWIMNLAYMTLGEYPDKVPPEHLIPESVFRPEYELKVFENVSMYMGLDVNDLAGGVITDDFNNDGFLDIITSSWGLFGEIKVFFSDGQGKYEDSTATSGLEGLTGGLNVIQVDYNNDGFLDFYICRSAWSGFSYMGLLPNSLIRNNGDGTFSDVTIEAGLYNPKPTQSAVWADFNSDGYIDIFVGNETHSSAEINPSLFYLNQKDGTFKEMASEIGLNVIGYIKGTAAGDIDNDGKPDLYLSILDGPNKLFLNTSSSTDAISFREIALSAKVQEPMESFPTWFFDYDNDGWEDLFVACFDQYSLKQQATEVAADYLGKPFSMDMPRLYRNLGNMTFADVTAQAGLNHALPTMGCNFGDLDNDGYLDFYLGSGAPDYRAIVPNRMFRNNEGVRYQDVTYSGNFGHIQKGHGISFADLDNDGDQDIYAVMGGSLSGDVFQNALFENPGNENNSITIQLTGTKSNRSAIGARIKLIATLPDGGSREIYHTIGSGSSFGANSLWAEIGLGTAVGIKEIQINWPNGDNTFVSYPGTPLGLHLQLTEGDSAWTSNPRKSFSFAKDHDMSGHK